MNIDLTDLFDGLEEDISFRVISSVVNGFGIPTQAEVEKVCKAIFTEGHASKRSPKNGNIYEEAEAEVWVAKTELENSRELEGSFFIYQGHDYKITGTEVRPQISSHVKYIAQLRGDV